MMKITSCYAGAGLFLLVSLVLISAGEAKKILTRKQALVIAESTQEVESFYNVQGGQFANCIESKVVATCDSDWVTCIEDAWVVQFSISSLCSLDHDGRVGITFLIDALTGEIISRYPEAAYFQNKTYCQEDYECMAKSESIYDHDECLNFIYGQIVQQNFVDSSLCVCQKNRCQPSP